MDKISGRIRHLIILLETQLVQLWLTVENERDEEGLFTARRHLHHALHWIDQVAGGQPSRSASLLPSEVLPFLSPNTFPIEPGATEELRDAIIQELGFVLHNLNAPARLQGPVDSYHNGLTDAEVLYLLQSWNDTHSILRTRKN
jgi:hypothetical protein